MGDGLESESDDPFWPFSSEASLLGLGFDFDENPMFVDDRASFFLETWIGVIGGMGDLGSFDLEREYDCSIEEDEDDY